MSKNFIQSNVDFIAQLNFNRFVFSGEIDIIQSNTKQNLQLIEKFITQQLSLVNE